MTRRAERVSKHLQRYVAQILDEEFNLPALASITRVTCDSGFSKAHVHVSFYGDERASRDAFEELSRNAWIVRRELSRRAQMRRTPELIFIADSSTQDGQEMIDLIDRISRR